MSLDYHLSLIRWVSANRGYLHPDIELAFNVDKGYHAKVVAGRTLEPGSCIARCSMTTSLSVLNALHNPPFSSRGTMFPSAFLLNQKVPVVQCFFLMEQWLLQDKSWWAPYLSTLPKPDEIGDRYFVDKEEDLLLFQGTNLQTAIRKQSETWKAQFTKGLDHLKRLDWPNATNGRYTWYAYASCRSYFSI